MTIAHRRWVRVPVAMVALFLSFAFVAAEAVSAQPGPPGIQVSKDASPASRPEPGGDFTFTVVVTNRGAVPVTITSLVDSIYGDLSTHPGSTCGALIGVTLAPGASSAPCSFVGAFTGPAGATQTDVVTATAVDASGTTHTDHDDATVTITAIYPLALDPVLPNAAPAPPPAAAAAGRSEAVGLKTSVGLLTLAAVAMAAQVAAVKRARRAH